MTRKEQLIKATNDYLSSFQHADPIEGNWKYEDIGDDLRKIVWYDDGCTGVAIGKFEGDKLVSAVYTCTEGDEFSIIPVSIGQLGSWRNDA